ncbi:hypothetical protein [Salipiger mucosus]|uniref:Uncharacterized protein n=1 Tax=Salipiger mucosus DSM 16094 TaxID=1123237 RepID=S9S6B6_9RHOB|nr:hypothetical protein [Salipiger mucosus]EPX85735.1 hypothetical protein Salmuc_05007 [Salipiger mucosus DSM 16094]
MSIVFPSRPPRPTLARARTPVFGGGLRARVSSVAGLILSDLLALAALCWAGGALLGYTATLDTALRLLALAGAVQVGLKAALGLYPGFGLHAEARLRKTASAWAGAGMIATLAALALHGGGAAVQMLFWPGFLALLALQAAFAGLTRAALSALGAWGMPVHVAGEDASAAALTSMLEATPGLGLRPVEDAVPSRTLLWADRALPEPETLAILRRTHDEIVLVSDLPRLRLSGVHPSEHGGRIGLRLTPLHEGPGRCGAQACL